MALSLLSSSSTRSIRSKPNSLSGSVHHHHHHHDNNNNKNKNDKKKENEIVNKTLPRYCDYGNIFIPLSQVDQFDFHRQPNARMDLPDEVRNPERNYFCLSLIGLQTSGGGGCNEKNNPNRRHKQQQQQQQQQDLSIEEEEDDDDELKVNKINREYFTLDFTSSTLEQMSPSPPSSPPPSSTSTTTPPISPTTSSCYVEVDIKKTQALQWASESVSQKNRSSTSSTTKATNNSKCNAANSTSSSTSTEFKRSLKSLPASHSSHSATWLNSFLCIRRNSNKMFHDEEKD